MTNSSANPQPQKYFFDAEFDYSETLEDIQSITPKKYTADLEAAKAEAYQEGHAAGVKETNESIARMAGDQLFVITSKLEELIETEANVMNHFHQDVAQVTDLIIGKILPVIADQGARQEVQGILETIQSSLPTDQTITITVHPQLREDIDAHITALKNNANFQAQILVAEDPTLTITDCKATWQGAGITQYKEATMAEIHNALMRLGKTPLVFTQPVDQDQNEFASAEDAMATQSESEAMQPETKQSEEMATETSEINSDQQETKDND